MNGKRCMYRKWDFPLPVIPLLEMAVPVPVLAIAINGTYIHTCQKVDQDVCLNCLSVFTNIAQFQSLHNTKQGLELRALWELSGSSLGALRELVAVVGIYII